MKKNNKGRLICLLKILNEYSDEEHVLSTSDIMFQLNNIGIAVNRKTVKDDIDVLIGIGIDIVTIKSSSNSFYLRTRDFKLPEVKLLVDAVSSSKFISREKSVELIQKLTNLVSKNQSSKLVRNLYIARGIKSDNQQIYEIVDIINDSINERKKIQFQYMDYTLDKKRVLRNKGELYITNPYSLVWSEDRYYLVGYSDKHNQIIKYRVDRMYRPKKMSVDSLPEPRDFSISEYTKSMFEMFCGKEETVVLECNNSLMNVIIDYFGEDVFIQRETDYTFTVRTNVIVSSVFYGWIFQFLGEIKIITPVAIKDEYRRMLVVSLE